MNGQRSLSLRVQLIYWRVDYGKSGLNLNCLIWLILDRCLLTTFTDDSRVLVMIVTMTNGWINVSDDVFIVVDDDDGNGDNITKE